MLQKYTQSAIKLGPEMSLFYISLNLVLAAPHLLRLEHLFLKASKEQLQQGK